MATHAQRNRARLDVLRGNVHPAKATLKVTPANETVQVSTLSSALLTARSY